VVVQKAVNGDLGVLECTVGAEPNANFELKVDPPLTVLSDEDKWAPIIAQTKAPLVLQWDTVQGTRGLISAPAAQRAEFSTADDEEMIRMDQRYLLTDDLSLGASSGDSAMTLDFSRTP
jgi:hypothetical protein